LILRGKLFPRLELGFWYNKTEKVKRNAAGGRWIPLEKDNDTGHIYPFKGEV
jgi:hypothetical protein